MNTIFKKVLTGSAVLALSTTVFATSSLAAGSGTEITGAPSITMSAVTTSQFTPITLDGTTQTVTAQINTFDVTDATGTGAGWNVKVSASQFNNTVKSKKLDANALVLDAAPSVSKIDINSDDPAAIVKLAGAIDNDVLTPVKILSAGLNEGMGSFRVAAIPMTLTLKPNEVYSGTYTSTVSVTLTTGP